jgi:EAL and modified HD-GYP domain-containing signal transduction protein
MLINFFRRLFGRTASAPPPRHTPSPARSPGLPPSLPAIEAAPAPLSETAPATNPAFETLNQQAPLKAPLSQAPQTELPFDEIGSAIICREAVLNRQQKIAGYQFLLKDSAHSNIRSHSRRVLQLYAEVLVDNLLRANIATLLGPRLAFIDLPDFFLDQPVLTELPVANTVIIVTPTNIPDAPEVDTLRIWISALRARGYRVGIPNRASAPKFAPLLSEVDLVAVQAPQLTAEAGINLSRNILSDAPKAALLVRALPGMEDFHFCYQIGAGLFQGPFITSREQWQAKNLGPNFARLTLLLSKLRQDAENREIVALLKQDGAITVRMLRYINSAANGLPEHVSSIERALVLLGREPLCRWLTIMMCSADRSQARSAAVLEAALVRARTMELIASSRPSAEREAMFLTGLLSLIDVILQQPIAKALPSLAISADIEDAILNNKGAYAPGLMLVKACESADIDAIVFAATLCDVTPEAAADWHMEALAWTLALQQEQEAA